MKCAVFRYRQIPDSSPVWLNNDSDDDEEVGEMRVGESQRDMSWIWKAAGSTGTDTDFEDSKFLF
jgi:hypothetical protein